MTSIFYTIFSDLGHTKVREVVTIHGDKAIDLLRSFANIKGAQPRERDIIAGCRIDRIVTADIDTALSSQAHRSEAT